MGFRTFEQRNLFAKGQIIGSAKVYGGTSGSVPLQRKAWSNSWCRKQAVKS